MKRAMVGILAMLLLVAFASPIMAISPYSADVKAGLAVVTYTDCGNVVVTTGGTLIAVINLSGACAYNTTTTLDVCRVLGGLEFFVTTIWDNNPSDGRISLLEGTKIGVFGPGEAFDFLNFREYNTTTPCDGDLEYTSGQPR